MDEYALVAAEAVAKHLVSELAPFCERIAVAGSVRRRCPAVHDLDLVAIPKLKTEDVGLPGMGRQEEVNLAVRFLESRPAWLVPGSLCLAAAKVRRFTYQFGGLTVPVDLYFATLSTWPTLLLIRTGSKEHNIRLCQRARELGLHLHADGQGLLDVAASRFRPVLTEMDIFHELGVPWREPSQRI